MKWKYRKNKLTQTSTTAAVYVNIYLLVLVQCVYLCSARTNACIHTHTVAHLIKNFKQQQQK